MNDSVSCTIMEEENNTSWDNFVAGLPGGFHEQSIPWASVRKNYGWNSKRIIFEKSGSIIAGAQVLIQFARPFGKIGYISYGPCTSGNSESLSRQVISGIKQFTIQEQIVYLILVPPYYGDHLVPLLKTMGFKIAIEGLPPKIHLTSTLLIDLNKTAAEILGEMKPRTRYNINLSIRKGIKIREGNGQDIDTFFRLMLATCARRKSPPTPSDKKFFELLWSAFHPRGWIRLHFADYNNEVVCAALSFAFGDTFRIWKFGWSGQYSNISPSNALYWSLIELSKNEGFRYFDFVSVDTDISKALENGDVLTPELKSKYFFGPTIFKMGFGGDLVHLPKAYCYFPNPIIRLLYNLFGRLFLQSAWLKKSINRIWAWGSRKRPDSL